MKRYFSWILVIVLALAALAMGMLWQRALRDDSDMAALAQAAAGEAYTRFSDYQARGDDGDYWGGVAAFHTFQEAYACLEAGASQAANRTFCSEVYGALLLSPEQGKAHMAECWTPWRCWRRTWGMKTAICAWLTCGTLCRSNERREYDQIVEQAVAAGGREVRLRQRECVAGVSADQRKMGGSCTYGAAERRMDGA